METQIEPVKETAFHLHAPKYHREVSPTIMHWLGAQEGQLNPDA
ncbi:MAG TPA: hypothetical protein VGN66_15820 [Sphingomonas sp.]|nr:hypothetical protein [Sphingomonas sp.]